MATRKTRNVNDAINDIYEDLGGTKMYALRFNQPTQTTINTEEIVNTTGDTIVISRLGKGNYLITGFSQKPFVLNNSEWNSSNHAAIYPIYNVSTATLYGYYLLYPDGNDLYLTVRTAVEREDLELNIGNNVDLFDLIGADTLDLPLILLPNA